MERDTKHIISVAETIRQQLVALTDRDILNSWGITGISATTCEDMPALKLNVTARLHKGSVIVALNEGADSYEIFLNDEKGRRKVAEDIFFDELSDFIDRTIEKGEDEKEYLAFCEQERIKLFSGQV